METAFEAGTVDTRPASALQGTDLASSSYPNCANTLRRRCPLAREECLDLCPHGALHLPAFVDSREGWDLHRWRTRRPRLDTLAQCVAQLCRAPRTSNTCEYVADTHAGVVRRAVTPGGGGPVAFHARAMDFVASLDLYRKVHKEAV